MIPRMLRYIYSHILKGEAKVKRGRVGARMAKVGTIDMHNQSWYFSLCC